MRSFKIKRGYFFPRSKFYAEGVSQMNGPHKERLRCDMNFLLLVFVKWCKEKNAALPEYKRKRSSLAECRMQWCLDSAVAERIEKPEVFHPAMIIPFGLRLLVCLPQKSVFFPNLLIRKHLSGFRSNCNLPTDNLWGFNIFPTRPFGQICISTLTMPTFRSSPTASLSKYFNKKPHSYPNRRHIWLLSYIQVIFSRNDSQRSKLQALCGNYPNFILVPPWSRKICYD